MSSYRIDSNETVSTDIEVRESDRYTEMVYLRFTRSTNTSTSRCDEMCITPEELEALGKHLISRAKDIKTEQTNRN